MCEFVFEDTNVSFVKIFFSILNQRMEFPDIGENGIDTLFSRIARYFRSRTSVNNIWLSYFILHFFNFT